MCLILIAHQVSKKWPLLVLANRDEFYARPAASAQEWAETPRMYAGRDLVAGGTWFGARNSRWATVTNIREGGKPDQQHNRSRGWLVRDYLQGDLSPENFFAQNRLIADNYAGYNLLLGDGQTLWYGTNRGFGPRKLPAGIYGLSNAFLDTPWPKLVRGKRNLTKWLESQQVAVAEALSLLVDTTIAEDQELPETGIPLEWERALSATFITMPGYGTRCSTLLSLTAAAEYRFIERRFDKDPQSWQESEFSWAVESR